MRWLLLSLLFAFTATISSSQCKDLQKTPLPPELDKLRVAALLGLQSRATQAVLSPEKNLRNPQVNWTPKLSITAEDDFRIIEMGLYNLVHGNWVKQDFQGPEKCKAILGLESLQVKKGFHTSVNFGLRNENSTQTTFGLFYIIGETASGEKVVGMQWHQYEGQLTDGSEILPLVPEKSELNWEGSLSDSSLTLGGSMDQFTAYLHLNNDSLINGSVSIQMGSLDHKIEELEKHLQSADFFDVKNHPTATFDFGSLVGIAPYLYKMKGQLCIKGICLDQEASVLFFKEGNFQILEFNVKIDRTEFDILFASSKNPHSSYAISDEVEIFGKLYFQRDFPGSTQFNQALWGETWQYE